ncbi:MAG: FeoA family protein [Pseudomonadota bacterium]
MFLDQLSPGQSADITDIAWDQLSDDEGRRLRALGIDAGRRVTVRHRGVFFGRDPMAIELGRTTIAIRRMHAKLIGITEPGTEESDQ